jgi:hypothetical protein
VVGNEDLEVENAGLAAHMQQVSKKPPALIHFWVSVLSEKFTRAHKAGVFIWQALIERNAGLRYSQKLAAQRGARTHDPEIKSLMLYRLS